MTSFAFIVCLFLFCLRACNTDDVVGIFSAAI